MRNQMILVAAVSFVLMLFGAVSSTALLLFGPIFSISVMWLVVFNATKHAMNPNTAYTGKEAEEDREDTDVDIKPGSDDNWTGDDH